MCELPVSIIIVGVGNANFNLMIELDGVFFNFKGWWFIWLKRS